MARAMNIARPGGEMTFLALRGLYHRGGFSFCNSSQASTTGPRLFHEPCPSSRIDCRNWTKRFTPTGRPLPNQAACGDPLRNPSRQIQRAVPLAG
jgi:hypothetical protein